MRMPTSPLRPGHGAQWMFHADHTYDRHPLLPMVAGVARRGAGVELRLHGCDPDRAEAAAKRLGFEVLASAADKPHGLREAYLADADGYIWVPDVPIPGWVSPFRAIRHFRSPG